MNELKIAMLGPSGVGKTSLLAAMYEQFDKNVGQAKLKLTAIGNEEKLQKSLRELKTLPDKFTSKGESVEPTRGKIISFIFGLAKEGEKKPFLQLKFQDYPGGFHQFDSLSEQKNTVDGLVRESDIVIIAIDAPALMEDDTNRLHELVNNPTQITSLFKKFYEKLNSPRLVIFAPVRCEKYVKNDECAKALLRRIEEGYTDLLKLFKSDDLLPWVVGVVTPVQTLGNMEFSRITYDENGKPLFIFKKKNGMKAPYSPKDTDQPLRYLLRFLLRVHIDNRRWGWLCDLFGHDTLLKNAVTVFASGYIPDNSKGFSVLQGENWLRSN